MTRFIVRTRSRLSAGLAFAIACGAPAEAAAAQTPDAGLPVVRKTLDAYCVTCHNERLKRGNLVLEHRDLARLADDAALWEKVLQKLRGGTMPPAGAPRPSPDVYAGTMQAIAGALDAASAKAPNPGRPLVHRLNRAEYANAVRDLLAVDLDGVDGPALLPPDSSGFGFDNVADILSMSPALLERYLSAARKISRVAVGDPGMRPDVKRYDVSKLLLQADREYEGQSYGTRGGTTVRQHFPLDAEYAFTVDFQLSYYQRRLDVRGLHEDNQVDVRLDGRLVRSFPIPRRVKPAAASAGTGVENSGEPVEPLTFRLPVKAGHHDLSVAIVKRIAPAAEGFGPSRLPQNTITFWWHNVPKVETGDIQLGIAYVEIAGPYQGTMPTATPSRDRVFVCQPTVGAEDVCAKRILRTLARRAYRRPPTAPEVSTLLGFYREGRRDGGDFEGGIRFAIERLLVAPQFLFRFEADPAKGVRAISDLELASRLSFLLWSSIPDDELLRTAEAGRLRDAVVLERQVRRMLADRKSDALLTNFFGQWLWLRNLATVRPDPYFFPSFDDTLRVSLQRETDLFIASQVREDRPVTELLTANYTFLNERVARHYGIPNIYGPDFRRVTLPGSQRAGLLGHGSILTVTAYANRTSPVIRAKWVLENLLGTPPPEPPANVPPIEDDEKGQVPSSMRAKMQRHRSNPVCASCHSMLDPLGFALENFDAIGQYRATEGDGTPIDASGAFPNGSKFDGPGDFRTALVGNRDALMTTVTQKLLTYALGRGAEHDDMPAVRRIVRESSAAGDRWSALILSVVRSAPFQMRRAQ
jgi:mono/diheme cytochrome c family protein